MKMMLLHDVDLGEVWLNPLQVTSVSESKDQNSTRVSYCGTHNHLGPTNRDGLHPLKIRTYSIHVTESPEEVARMFEEATGGMQWPR